MPNRTRRTWPGWQRWCAASNRRWSRSTWPGRPGAAPTIRICCLSRGQANLWDEIAFLKEIARRTGCGLLLDVNNVYVGSRNLGYSAEAYLDSFPGEQVLEIHIAGHTPDPKLGESLLVDSHDAPVAPAVWTLYERLIARIGARPTLIERDDNLPDFSTLLTERERADMVLRAPLARAA
jgi:uncharacterized protein